MQKQLSPSFESMAQETVCEHTEEVTEQFRSEEYARLVLVSTDRSFILQ